MPQTNTSDLDSEFDPLAYQGIATQQCSVHDETYNQRCNIYDDSSGGAEKKGEEKKYRKRKPIWRIVVDFAYPNYVLDHLDYKSFKTVIRTWIHVWSSVILIIVPKTSKWIGMAPYLLQIFGFITALGGQLIIHAFYISFTSFVYLVLAWVNMVIALAITSRIRGWKSKEWLEDLLISDGSCTAENILSCLINEVATGRFLELRCTVIFIFAIMFAVVLSGMTMTYNMTLRPAYVAAIIITLAVCNSYVGLPVFIPKELGYVVARPLAITMAMRLVASMVIFPTTANFLYLEGTLKVLYNLRETMRKNTNFIKTLKPSADGFTDYLKLSDDITAQKNKVSMLEFLAGIVKFEVSFGRFDIGDIGEFRALLRNLISLGGGYEYFYQLLHERKDIIIGNFSNHRSSVSSHVASSKPTGHSKFFTALQESYKAVGQFEDSRRRDLLKEKIHATADLLTLKDLDDVADFIKAHFISVTDKINDSLKSLDEWLNAANQFRIYSLIPGKYSQHKNRQRECAENIKKAKETLINEIQKCGDIKFLESLMRQSSKNEEAILCLISQTSLFLSLSKDHCRYIIKIIDLFISIDESRPTPKLIWWYTASRRDKPNNINSYLSVGDANQNSFNLYESSSKFWQSNVLRRDADVLPPSHFYHFIGRKSISLAGLLMNKHLLFWIRLSGIIVISFIPNFCRTTAAWYYSNRLFWVPLMCAVTVTEHLGQTVINSCVRIFYLFIGCVVGMVGWYISTGNGKGNYYGFGVVTAILYLIISYFRHFSVHATFSPAILFCATVVVVMGTSWQNAQYPVALVLVGYGFTLAWKRLVTVIIGVALCSLSNLFPKVLSSRVIVRDIFSKSLDQIGNLHCDISKFAIARITNPDYHIITRNDPVLERFNAVSMKLASTTQIIPSIKYEIPVSGNWPRKKYSHLQKLVTDIVQLYLLLYLSFDQLEDPEYWGPIMIGRVGFSDPSMSADIFSVIHMASGSLRSKNALPKITQANLSLKHLDLLCAQWGLEKLSLSERFYNKESSFTEKEYSATEDGEPPNSVVKHLDFKKLLSPDGQCNIVALLYAHMIYKRIDRTMNVIKSLVGEVYGYELEVFDDKYRV